MITRKFTTERVIRNFSSDGSMSTVELYINSMIKEFFNELMICNMVAEGDTLRFDIDEAVIDKADKTKRVTIKMSCMMRSAKSRSYDPDAI